MINCFCAGARRGRLQRAHHSSLKVQQQGWQDLEVGLLKFSILLRPLGHGSAVFWQQGLLLNLQLPINEKKKAICNSISYICFPLSSFICIFR